MASAELAEIRTACAAAILRFGGDRAAGGVFLSHARFRIVSPIYGCELSTVSPLTLKLTAVVLYWLDQAAD